MAVSETSDGAITRAIRVYEAMGGNSFVGLTDFGEIVMDGNFSTEQIEAIALLARFAPERLVS